jgi:hypothetical protein
VSGEAAPSRLSAQSTTVIDAGRVFQDSTRAALADVKVCFRPRLGVRNFSVGSNSDATLRTKSGSARVGTLAARSPSCDRSILEISAIHM